MFALLFESVTEKARMGHRRALEEKALPFLSLHATINEILVADLSEPQSSSVVDLNTAISKPFPQAAAEGE